MFRKIICCVFLTGILLSCGISVYASESYGSIRIIPDWAGNRMMDGQIVLYRIGEMTTEGYRITDGLTDWVVQDWELQSDDFKQWAMEQAWKEGRHCKIVDEQGALFEDLEEGLYFVVQTVAADGFSKFDPFFITLPFQTYMDVTVNPEILALSEIPETGDYPAPIVAAMMLSLGIVFFLVLSENRKK